MVRSTVQVVKKSLVVAFCFLQAASSLHASDIRSLGASLGCIGDINGDGFDDYAAGAPGRATIFDSSNPDVPVVRGEIFGSAVSGAVVLIDGSSFKMIKTIRPNSSEVGFGQSILCLPAKGGWETPLILAQAREALGRGDQVQALSPTTGKQLFAIQGPEGYPGFGRTMILLDDSAVGHVDVAIAACEPSSLVSAQSAVFAFRVTSSGASQLWAARSPETGAAFGESMCIVGSGAADGKSALIVGAPCFHDASQTQEGPGAVYRIAIGDGGVLECQRGLQSGERFGSAAKALWDFDGDDYQELAVGCPGFDGESDDEGRVAILSGLSLSVVQSLELKSRDAKFPSTKGACYGSSLCPVEYRGRKFMAVSAPWGNWNGSNEGWIGILEMNKGSEGSLSIQRFGMTGWDPELTIWTLERAGLAMVPAGKPYADELGAFLFGAPDDVTPGGVQLYALSNKSTVQDKQLAPK